VNKINRPTIEVARYANISVGHEWGYSQSKYPTEPWRVVVESETFKNGHDVFLVQEYDDWGFKNDQDFISRDFSAGMTRVGGLNDYGQPTESEWYYNPPVPSLLSEFTPGQTYSFEITHTDGPTVFTAHLTIVNEPVTVPIGAFANAWKSTQVFYLGEESFVFQSWFVKDIGLVKRIQEDGNTWELTNVAGFSLPL